MKLATPKLDIGEDDSFGQDVLDRKRFGESLKNLLSRSDDALVIALSAPWGEGKTTFVHMWRGLLKQNGINSIYFDAFENDYVDDAFIAIASQIVGFIENELDKQSSARKKLSQFKKKASKVGGQLLTWTAKLGVKAATLGVVKESDIDELKDIKSDLAKGTSEVVSKFVENRITSHEQNVQSIRSFKDTLTAIALTIREETEKPLVIIIDELDRCKPTYAVEIVEKIKHLFSVENIIFVLVMNKPQLEEAVKSVYGQGVDANTYLQKFINVECSLPKNVERRHINDHKRYSNRLYELHDLETWGDKSHLLDSIAALSEHLDLSLRELEKCFTYISIFYGSVGENYLRLTPIIALLAVLKIRYPKLYLRISRNEAKADELIKVTKLPETEPENQDSRKLWFMGLWMRFCLLSDEEYDALEEGDRIKGFERKLFQYNVSRQQIIPEYAAYMDLFALS